MKTNIKVLARCWAQESAQKVSMLFALEAKSSPLGDSSPAVETDALVECQRKACSQKAFKSVFKSGSTFSSGPLFPGQSLADHPPNL